MVKQIQRSKLESPLGLLYLAADAKGLRHLSFTEPEKPSSVAESCLEAVQILEQAELQLQEYFLGRRYRFELPLVPQGTTFQLKVWAALSKIPYGSTLSYGELAQQIGHERATCCGSC